MRVCIVGCPVGYVHIHLLSGTVECRDEGRVLQADKPCLQAMLEEYPLLALRPFDVLQEDIDLDFLAVGDGVKAIKKCAD